MKKIILILLLGLFVISCGEPLNPDIGKKTGTSGNSVERTSSTNNTPTSTPVPRPTPLPTLSDAHIQRVAKSILESEQTPLPNPKNLFVARISQSGPQS